MNAKINIVTTQYEKKRVLDTIKQQADANIYYKNEDLYVVYKEVEMDKPTTTTIKISDNKISIKKFGEVNSTMNFEKGVVNKSKYRTPQGLFIIETKTRELKIDKKTENCIKLNIDYDINIMNLFNGRNKIDILLEIKE